MADTGATQAYSEPPVRHGRRATDRTVESLDRAARVVNFIASKQGLGALFALILLAWFFWSQHEVRQDMRAEQQAMRAEREKIADQQTKALEQLARAMERQADVLSDQKAALNAIETLMRVQVQEDLRVRATPPAPTPSPANRAPRRFP